MGETTNIEMVRLQEQHRILRERFDSMEAALAGLPAKLDVVIEKQDALSTTVRAHMVKDESEHAVLRESIARLTSAVARLTTSMAVLTVLTMIALGFAGVKAAIPLLGSGG